MKSTKTLNEILIRRKQKFIVGDVACLPANSNMRLVIAMMKNFEEYGYTLSQDLAEYFMTCSDDQLNDIYTEMIEIIKPLVGADKEYNPMYPNFPKQVAEADDWELFWNAIIHYWSFGTLMPDYKKDERFPLIDNPKLVKIDLGTYEDVYTVFNNLLSSKTNLSKHDRTDIKTIIEDTDNWMNYLPSEIPLKETVAFFGKLVMENNLDVDLSIYFKTATDVLRLVTALSDGDISLAENTRFRKLRRRERRIIMELLYKCGNILEDMFRYQNRWIRIGEVVHPGEWRSKYEKFKPVWEAFDKLRRDDKPLFFAGKVHQALNSGDMMEVATLLKARPGEFARLLDKCVRDSDNPKFIIELFRTVADKVAVPVLLQVKYHFMWRVNPDEYRVIFPKGNTATATVLPYQLEDINGRYCLEIIAICDKAIKKQLAEKQPLGNVYIDSELENYIVPFSQRSASSGNKLVTRGSTFPIREDAKAVRGFIWWTNQKSSRVDIDLSAAMYDENWKWVSYVSYTRLRDHNLQAYHSGDITNGGPINGDGVAEFIDFDIDAIAKQARYVVFQIYSYTRQFFSEMNCRFGWMEREDVNSGEIFEPKTVTMAMGVTSQSMVCIPVIFDCKERKIIWCDLNVGINQTGHWCGGNNLESNLQNVNFICYAMTHMVKPNMEDLAHLNAEARGNLVFDRNKADIIFSNDTTKPTTTITKMVNYTTLVTEEVEKDIPIITAYDLDYWMGQML